MVVLSGTYRVDTSALPPSSRQIARTGTMRFPSGASGAALNTTATSAVSPLLIGPKGAMAGEGKWGIRKRKNSIKGDEFVLASIRNAFMANEL